MFILILIDVQYSQKAVFSFEKGLNCQNHYSLGSLHLVTPPPAPPQPEKFLIPPYPLFTNIWKTLPCDVRNEAIFLILEYSSLWGLNKKTARKNRIFGL